MKNLKLTVAFLVITCLSLSALSCKDNKKSEESQPMEMANGMDATNMENDNDHMGSTTESEDNTKPRDENAKPTIAHVNYNVEGPVNPYAIIDTYLRIKDALVADDSEKAKSVAKSAMPAWGSYNISSFDPEQQQKLKDIISKAVENAQIIAFASLKEQRENFKELSIHLMDLIAITGTDSKLYQQYCPMYDKGSSWLSAQKDIKNPYYGSKMLTCGTVKMEIN